MKLPTTKMSYFLVLLYSQITIIRAAPLLLLPVSWVQQNDVLSQQTTLQKQLMELQALKQLNVPSPLQMNNQLQPLVILLPNEETNPNVKLRNENEPKPATRTKFESEELNSIVIDAASDVPEDHVDSPKPQRAIIILPNDRLSLGGIISAIPWLPIEINVPDTIGWVYNGISSGIGSIISIIGSPFQGTPQGTSDPNLRTLLKQMQTKNQNVVRPMVLMPIDGPVLPIQV